VADQGRREPCGGCNRICGINRKQIHRPVPSRQKRRSGMAFGYYCPRIRSTHPRSALFPILRLTWWAV
jgi:hypothetical protein